MAPGTPPLNYNAALTLRRVLSSPHRCRSESAAAGVARGGFFLGIGVLANMVDKRPIPAGNVGISCLSKLFHFVGCDAGPQRYQNWPNMGYLMQKQKGVGKRERKKSLTD